VLDTHGTRAPGADEQLVSHADAGSPSASQGSQQELTDAGVMRFDEKE
jgi:hypothetical protein